MAYLVYLISYSFLWLLALLPLRALYVISDGLYFIVYYLVGYRKKVVFENLRNSFPEKSDEEITHIAKDFYKYFCQLIVEIVKLFNISEKELKSRICFKNPEVFTEMYNKGRHGIVVMAHYGNWEWLSGITDRSEYQNMSVYKPQSNKYFEQMINKHRTRFTADVVPMNQAVRAILKYKKEGRLSVSLFITDQIPKKSQIQYWTTFLNQETGVYMGAEKIARSLDLAVMMFKIRPVKRGFYEIEIVKLYEDVKNVPEYDVTETYTREMENLIREKPQYWLWTHRRWKHKREPQNAQG